MRRAAPPGPGSRSGLGRRFPRIRSRHRRRPSRRSLAKDGRQRQAPDVPSPTGQGGALAEPAEFAGQSCKPPDGLEPSTPSLPWNVARNRWQSTATVCACFAVSGPVPFAADCHRLHPRGSIKAPSHVRRPSALSQIPCCPVRDGVERFELRISSKASSFAAAVDVRGFALRPRGG